MLGCQREQVRPVPRDQLLVGRHHRLAGLQRLAHNLRGWVQAADELDDDVGIRFEHCVDVVRPDDVAWDPGLPLPFHVAVADVSQPEALTAVLAQDLRDGPTYGSEANQSNSTYG